MKLTFCARAVLGAIAVIELNASSGTVVAQTLPKYEIIPTGATMASPNQPIGAAIATWFAIRIDRVNNKVSACVVNLTTQQGRPPVLAGGCRPSSSFLGNTSTSTFAAMPPAYHVDAYQLREAFWSIDVTNGQVTFCRTGDAGDVCVGVVIAPITRTDKSK